MSGRRRDLSQLLRWYPATWRERYGDELLALIDDEIGDSDPPFRLRLSLARHGLTERARGAGLVGPSASRESDLRRGFLLVLIAWSSFVVAGAGYSKAAEHFQAAVPAGSHTLPSVAFDIVVAFGVLGGILVLVGAAIAAPGLFRLLRDGAWPGLRRHAMRAIAVSAGAVAAVVPLALWAHHLSDNQRNGGSVGYSAAFLAWATLVVISIALWTAVAVAVGRRVHLSPPALRAEAALAIGAAAAMVVVALAIAVWWAAMAIYAPPFLSSARPGAVSAAFNLPLDAVAAVMLFGLAVSSVGVRRIVRA
jgi:hypothetical protein